jgi:hypothetical protein
MNQQNRPLKQFDSLIGEWDMVGTHPMIPQAVRGHSRFDWLKPDALLVWHFNWESGSDIPNALSVIGQDDAFEPCSMLYTDERGVSRIYQMTLERGIWKMWRDTPGFSQRMTGTFSESGDTITVIGELSRAGSGWEQDLNVVYTR